MERPIRVLHVVVNMNRGGAETLLMNLYRKIDHTKIQFDFLTCKEGIFDDEIKQLGGIVYRIPYVTDVGHFLYMNELKSFFNIHDDYKIVHAHMDKMSGLVLKVAAKAGIPHRIAHSHNTKSEGNIIHKGYKWIIGRNIPSYSTKFVACSKVAGQWLFNKKSSNILLLRNGVNSEEFYFSKEKRNKIRDLLNISKEQFVVGHIGRFNMQKNHQFILDIFSEVLKEIPNAKLLLIGDGPLKDKIKSRAVDLDINNSIMFLGIRDDVNELISAFDCLLFPSIHEGLPVTLIEAQASGIHCLVSNVITNEVDIGAGLISYESLKSSPKVWAKKLMNLSASDVNCEFFIKENGFNISDTAQKLQDMYMHMGKNFA
ncbi:glycosyltransferase family 1 protein [Bacillus carboniphilus]|uniref:Glycosyltransferase family 1 protein n=1 Tax=Bacillus carboniphilus TaxID=86663 RepID=A0ABY9JYS8_9BACI|nr:glycosyltransferase family 1 protein [Bacillus carboniphilus]WLR42781.1 glycosyltransferase family 1 protein [Bacillus carboniphilus]